MVSRGDGWTSVGEIPGLRPEWRVERRESCSSGRTKSASVYERRDGVYRNETYVGWSFEDK